MDKWTSDKWVPATRESAGHFEPDGPGQVAQVGECEWTENADGLWTGACSLNWAFESGGPAENGMNFCPKCGRHLVTAATPKPEENNDDDSNLS